MTTRQVSNAIKSNVDAWWTRRISFETFDAEQKRLWDYAQNRSARFLDLVSQQIMPSMKGGAA